MVVYGSGSEVIEPGKSAASDCLPLAANKSETDDSVGG